MLMTVSHLLLLPTTRLYLANPRFSDTFSRQMRIEARCEKRQWHLQQLEIPEHQLELTDSILGRNGFGEAYLADYMGINVAAEVLQIDVAQQKHDTSLNEAKPIEGGE